MPKITVENYTKVLEQLTALLLQTTTSLPVVFGAIAGISAIIRGVTGQGPSPTQLADMIEAQCRLNGISLPEGIARLRAMIAERDSGEGGGVDAPDTPTP